MVQSHVPALCTAGYHPPGLEPLASMGPRDSGTLRGPAPYTLHLTGLYPILYTPHSIPHSLHPVPHTLHLVAHLAWVGRLLGLVAAVPVIHAHPQCPGISDFPLPCSPSGASWKRRR